MKPKPTKQRIKAKSFSISLTPDLFNKASKEAFRRHQSFSALVREVLLRELEAAR